MQKTQEDGKRNIIYTLVRNSKSRPKKVLDLTRVVHLAHIDNLSAECVSDLLGVTLAHEGLVGGLDRVHWVP
jgi:hypothetical protein